MNVYTPSQAYISDLYTRISDSRMLVKSWVFIDKISDTPDKMKLKSLHDNGLQDGDGYPETAEHIMGQHPVSGMLCFISIRLLWIHCFRKHQYIMEQLNSFEKYDDTFIIFEVTPMTEEGGDVMMVTHRILAQIDKLKKAGSCC